MSIVEAKLNNKIVDLKKKDQYIDLKNNGRLFPSWVLHNFKKYKLPEIIRKDNEDPCNVQTKLELRKYQEFIGKYLGPTSPYNSILLYHGLGSGKTATSINLMNVIYNYNPNVNVIILIKASLRDDPWMKDLQIWLGKTKPSDDVGDLKARSIFSTIHFVHYDSPYADRDFIELMKKIDTTKRMVYIVDEAHNFIRNVYSNLNSKMGKRAQVIYEYIVKDKKENKDTKVVLISATPGINTPFELSLMFNMLRPGILPMSELEFNRLFITDFKYPILNPARRNTFERRITGLVSYYVGATSDLYAQTKLHYVNLPMSEYQYEVYRVFEKMEQEIMEKAKRFGKISQLYRTYTRQASNFVFPYVNINITGELRPRPGKFKISDKTADYLSRGREDKVDAEDPSQNVKMYLNAVDTFMKETEKYFQNIKKQDKRSIEDDINDFKAFKENLPSSYDEEFRDFYFTAKNKSKLFVEMYNCSPKMTAISFYSYIAPGKAMAYSNYVLMEGLEILKVYLRLVGFDDYKTAKKGFGYCEYNGRIGRDEREKSKKVYNADENVRGDKCKIFLLSPSGTEGIQLYDVRDEYLIEPYWTEVRINQVAARGVRQCSHKNLPMDERIVNIYRFKVVKPELMHDDDNFRQTADEYVEDQAKAKDNLIQSFLSAMKEAAVDCELFKAHNMISQNYSCFKYPEEATMGSNIGPAYHEDMKEDIKYDLGLHSKNSHVERIKVIKIMGVYITNNNLENPEFSHPKKFLYYPKNGVVYDYDTHYPVGLVTIINGLPNKLDKDTYIITDHVHIPTVLDVAEAV